MIRLSLLLAKKVYAQNYTVLAIREAFDPVVARRAECLSATVAANYCRVLTVISTIH